MSAAPIALLAIAPLLLFCPGAWAHTTATGLATITVAETAITYRLTLVLGELPEGPARLLGAAVDGEPASVDRVAEALRTQVRIQVGGAACRPGRILIQGSRVGDPRATLELALRCPAAPQRLRIREDWFDLFGEHYRTLARVEGRGAVREVAFLPDAREATIDLGGATPGPHRNFLWLGIHHILSGYDHLLFLAALLLGGGSFWTLVKIVTAFTLAHSVTLALAVLGLVAVPARIVEPVIAVSIVWVALENVLLQHAPSRRWLVSFLFGLAHGFGFASALEGLALPPWNLGMALLGFNLGVEAGQALVIAMMLPLLLWMRARPWEPALARAASLLLAAIGAAWFVERLFFA
ncbi:MAG TPA: HupE/UreJ family protein [Methylomirabilota bacterium]|nr:HupE/UreJ family protein [Methylomirabilota bacterium]